MLSSRLAAWTSALALAVAFVMGCLAVTPAFALTLTPDQLATKGSLSVTMRDAETHQAVSGGQLSLYQVATVELDNANLAFAFTPDFAASDVSLENVEDQDLARLLAQYAQQNDVTATKVSISDAGTARFDQLGLGLYLVVQSTPAEGYNAVLPFMVTLPGQEGDAWVFNVDASPKVELCKSVPSVPPTPSKPTSPLPQTGQLNWPVPVCAAAGGLLLLAGCVLLFSGKGRKAKRR